jgi:two-component system CheB/CheR fusion protein
MEPDYRLVFEQAPGLFLLLGPDAPRFTILHASLEYLRATLTRSAEIVGRGLFEVFPDDPGEPAATGTRNLRASLERVLEARAPDAVAVQKYDLPRRGPEAGFEERYWSSVNAPVLAPSGEITCIVHCVEDVTEWVRRGHATMPERELAATVEAAGMGFWLRDADRRSAFWSDRMKALFGLDDEAEVTIDAFVRAIDPRDRERIRRAVEDALKRGSDYDAEMRVPRPGGKVRWIAARGRVFRDASGKPEWLAGIAMDVTDLKEAREALEREKDLALEIARYPEENPDPVLGLTSGLSVRYANAAARSVFGLEAGQPLPPTMLEAARQAATERRSLRAELPFGERYFAVHFVPVGGSLNVYGQDVTERRRAEDRMRRMYESGMIGVLYWTVDGRITDANDKFLEMAGYSREDLAAGRMSWTAMTPPEWRHLDERALADFKATGISEPFEKEYVRKDGTKVPIIIGGAMLDEQRHEGVAFVIDIGDRKRAEAERDELIAALREADRRKNDFLGMLSHELRNPLAPIRNSLYILGRAAPGGERARHALAVIDRQVQHTTRLVDDLLDVTRISRGKVRLRRERLDLGELARRTAEDHRDLFARSGVHLDLDVAAEPLPVNVDATRIAQVIGNLLQNAVKFTPRGGRALLAVSRGEGSAIVTVQDSGAGIAPDVMARLFEPFMQADSTLDRSSGGLGLGLALVRGLAELHGGSVTAHSEGMGRGATFTVRLPLERRREPRLSAVPARPATPAARRLLVIEDNVDSAETLKEALELNDHVVDIALTGPEGLEKARALHPDVVLCDIGLPGMDGFQVARQVRADPAIGGVALIALSGYAQAEDLERSREAGFDLHLAKPPALDELERAIDQVREAAARRVLG